MPSGDRATPGVPLDNPGQRVDSAALLGISAPARRERAAGLARDLAPILEDIRRRRHHEPQPTELARDIPGIAGLVSGSGAPTDRPAGGEPSSEKQITGMIGSAATQVNR